MEQKLWTKGFTLVVIGQIISLFGNAAIRFAPVGGIVADRINKRNIMVTLDFFTAGVAKMR